MIGTYRVRGTSPILSVQPRLRGGTQIPVPPLIILACQEGALLLFISAVVKARFVVAESSAKKALIVEAEFSAAS